MRCAVRGTSHSLNDIEPTPRALARGQGAVEEVAVVVNIKSLYAVIGMEPAAASVRPVGLLGRGELCPQHVQRSTGWAGTTATAARLRQRTGELSVMKINKFDFPSVSGSTVLRPPV
jgi:hypothetical protein